MKYPPKPDYFEIAHSPLTSNLVAAFPFREGGGSTTRDVVRRTVGTFGTNITWKSGKQIYMASSSNTGVVANLPITTLGTTNITIMVLAFLPGNTYGTFCKIGSSEWDGVAFGVGSSALDAGYPGNNLICLRDGISYHTVGAIGGYGWKAVTMRVEANRYQYFWVDGRYIGAVTGGFANPTGGNRVHIGGHATGARRGLVGGISDAYVFNNDIPPNAIIQLQQNPYLIYRKNSDRWSLKAYAVATTTVHLAWVDNSEGEDSFSIERDTDGGGFSEIDTVVAETETYDDTVDEGHTYTYRVRAISTAKGNSEYTNEAEVTV